MCPRVHNRCLAEPVRSALERTGINTSILVSMILNVHWQSEIADFVIADDKATVRGHRFTDRPGFLGAPIRPHRGGRDAPPLSEHGVRDPLTQVQTTSCRFVVCLRALRKIVVLMLGLMPLSAPRVFAPP